MLEQLEPLEVDVGEALAAEHLSHLVMIKIMKKIMMIRMKIIMMQN